MEMPFFIDSIDGGYAAGATRNNRLEGKLPDGFDVRELESVFELALISTAGAFNLAAGDAQTIMAALLGRYILDTHGNSENVSLSPGELRALYYHLRLRDSWVMDPNFRVGAAVPATGGASQTVRVGVRWSFVDDRNEDDPVWCPSSDQLSLPGQAIRHQLGTHVSGGNIVLSGGTAVVTVSDVKLFAHLCRSAKDGAQAVPHVAPAWQAKPRTVTTQLDTENVAHVPVLLADERDPDTVSGQLNNVTIIRDNVPGPRRVNPAQLACDYVMSQPAQAPIPSSIDLTEHSLGGIEITPLIWLQDGATDYDWPVVYGSRQYDQQLAAAGSPNATHLDCRILSISEAGTQSQIRQLVERQIKRGDTSLPKLKSMDELPVRGGGAPGNMKNKLFKGRYIVKP